MQDESVDAPQLELTAEPAAGEDALQLNAADSPDPATNLGDAFSIKNKKPKTEPALPMKVAKAVTAEANDSVVAALMGLKLPSAKAKAKPSVSAAVASVTIAPVEPEPRPQQPVAESLPNAYEAFEETVVTPAAAVDTERYERDAAVQGADQVPEVTAAPAETPVPMMRLVYPPLEDEPVTEAALPSTEIEELASVEEPEIAVEPSTPADPLPDPPPAYRERGPEDAQPSTPKPRRAIPVAPQWPSEPPQATPKRRAAPLPAPAEIPTPPVHIVPAARAMPAAPKGISPRQASIDEPAGRTGAWWTIPLTFVGIAIVACSILIPASDENRRANYELAKIERDVDYFERQSAVNKDFIERVNTDATLAERLALRQLHQTRQGVKIAPMSGKPDAFGASPFAMTRLDPPVPLPPYEPVQTVLSEWFTGEKQAQQMAALGLIVAGAGVMLGGRRGLGA